MRKLAVVLALASTALATPALARDNSWYVGVEAGAMLVEDLEFDVGAANNVPRRGSFGAGAGIVPRRAMGEPRVIELINGSLSAKRTHVAEVHLRQRIAPVEVVEIFLREFAGLGLLG